MSDLDLDLDYVRFSKVLKYDPTTGIIRWKRANKIAGAVKHGTYLVIGLGRKTYQAHRVAWLLYYRKWPKYQIDHINGIFTDNRISNLRDVRQESNQQNIIDKRSDNSSGYRGVDWSKQKQKWRARIRINGVSMHIGFFDTAEDAGLAYLVTKKLMHDCHIMMT